MATYSWTELNKKLREKVIETVETIKEEKVVDIDKMTKKELDEYASTLGIELDRRKTLKAMKSEFNKQLNKEEE